MERTASPRMRIRLLQLGLSFVAAAILVAACAGRDLHPEKIGLLRSAQVSQGKITLADLLPAFSPSSLHESAAHVSLGAAPQPGSARALTSEQIERQLRNTPDILAQLEIPDRILVTRTYRALSRSEIVRALEEALKAEGFGESTLLKEKDFSLQAPVLVTRDDSGLKATRVEYDRLQHKAVFRLWTSNEPAILPFYVTIDDFPGAESLAGRSLAPGVGRVATGSAQSPVLARPGKPARLVAEGPNFRFSTIVVPLQQGRKGQLIRVREKGTRRLLKARVVSEGLLQAQF